MIFRAAKNVQASDRNDNGPCPVGYPQHVSKTLLSGLVSTNPSDPLKAFAPPSVAIRIMGDSFLTLYNSASESSHVMFL